jgi:hypothetical protein
METLINLIVDNPIIASAVSGAVVAFVAFIKPIAKALRRALIRRIDQAWPDDCDNVTYEEKIRRTVEAVNAQTLIPRGTIERTVREHKTNPPPVE